MVGALRAWIVCVGVVLSLTGCGSESAVGSGGDGGAAGAPAPGGEAGSAGGGAAANAPSDEEGLLGEGWELVCKLGLCDEDPELGDECQQVYDACVGRGHYRRSCRSDADRTCGVFGQTGPY